MTSEALDRLIPPPVVTVKPDPSGVRIEINTGDERSTFTNSTIFSAVRMAVEGIDESWPRGSEVSAVLRRMVADEAKAFMLGELASAGLDGVAMRRPCNPVAAE